MMPTLIDAGGVEPGTSEYVVAWAGNHTTLRVNDLVVMVETPDYENMLLRKSDLTLHSIVDERNQYVILAFRLEAMK